MKEKIEITIQEVNQILMVLEELPIKYIGIAQYVTTQFTKKFEDVTGIAEGEIPDDTTNNEIFPHNETTEVS